MTGEAELYSPEIAQKEMELEQAKVHHAKLVHELKGNITRTVITTGIIGLLSLAAKSVLANQFKQQIWKGADQQYAQNAMAAGGAQAMQTSSNIDTFFNSPDVPFLQKLLYAPLGLIGKASVTVEGAGALAQASVQNAPTVAANQIATTGIDVGAQALPFATGAIGATGSALTGIKIIQVNHAEAEVERLQTELEQMKLNLQRDHAASRDEVMQLAA